MGLERKSCRSCGHPNRPAIERGVTPLPDLLCHECAYYWRTWLLWKQIEGMKDERLEAAKQGG